MKRSLKNLSILILFFFAFFINQYYGNIGLFPHDSAAHFDNGFRILNGEHPVRDFWIISGFIIDYIQSVLFFIFGTSWQTYIAHASLFNALITVYLLFFLISLKLDFFYSLVICLSFSILAYPSSGTPFVDHHSSFFSLALIFSLILVLRKEHIFFWYIIPFLMLLAILSKMVPATYFALLSFIIIFIQSKYKKNYSSMKHFIFGCVVTIIIFLLILISNKISMHDFMVQNFLYPQSIGSERFINLLNTNIINIIFQFKYIFFLNLILIFILFKNFRIKNRRFEKETLIIILTSLIFVFHQILTKNQIFINFLIPIQIGFILIILKKNKFIFNSLVIIMLLLTYKYHSRFNQERKFHELSNVNFDKAIPANIIDEKLNGLKWITPQYSKNPKEEVNKIIEIKKILKDEKNFMLMTNYSFFSVILEKKTYTPARWFTFDGTDFPRINNKFKIKYKNLFKDLIVRNEIKKIFLIKPVTTEDVYTYFDKSCFKEEYIGNDITKLMVMDCSEI